MGRECLLFVRFADDDDDAATNSLLQDLVRFPQPSSDDCRSSHQLIVGMSNKCPQARPASPPVSVGLESGLQPQFGTVKLQPACPASPGISVLVECPLPHKGRASRNERLSVCSPPSYWPLPATRAPPQPHPLLSPQVLGPPM